MFTREGQLTWRCWDAVCGGSVREGPVLLALLSAFSVTSPATPNQIGSFWCWCPGGCGFVRGRPRWVSPRNSPVRLGVSPAVNPHRYFQSEALRLYFPTLKLWVVWWFLLPSCSSWFICTWTWDCPGCRPPPRPVHQPLPCCESSLPSCPSPPLLSVWMNVSLTPWLSDFHTVWFSVSSRCVFVFKFVVDRVLVVRGGTVCLPMPPSWLEVNVIPILLDLLYLFIWDGSLGTAYIWVLFSYPLSYPMSFGCSI